MSGMPVRRFRHNSDNVRSLAPKASGDTRTASGISPISHITQPHRLPQPLERVARRNELLADEALIVDLDQLSHHRRVVDLLPLVELAAAGVAGGVDVADQVAEL